MKNWLVVFALVCSLAQASVAQTSTTQGFMGFRRGLATVMLAGLGGAVLGLSTLSFYGEPQDHIGNIWTGLAIGVVGGSVYVISQSQRPLGANLDLAAPPTARIANRPPMFSYTWEF